MMQDCIDWIIESITFIDLVQVLATSVIAFATFVLWLATRNLARASKQKPFAVCFMESSLHSLHAVNVMVKNTGNAAAFDIKVNITPALPKVGVQCDYETETNRKISILAPDQPLSCAAFQIQETPEDIKKYPLKEFNVIVSWASKPKGQNRETISYTIGNIDDFRRKWTDNGLHEIHQALEKSNAHFEKTAKHLETISKHFETPKEK